MKWMKADKVQEEIDLKVFIPGIEKIIGIMKLNLLCLVLFLVPLGHLAAQVQVGDGTNFSKIESDGTLEFNGTATVWDDYVVPFTSIKVRAATNEPGFIQFQDDGVSAAADVPGVYSYAFDPGSRQEVFFTIQMPHSWAGTAIHPHIHWSPSTSATGSVVWGMEYTWINYNPTESLVFPATDTLLAVSDAISSTQALHHLITGFQSITPSPNQSGISSILVVRFYRDAENVNDSYGADAFALSFDIHYERNTVGSRQEFIK